MCGAPAPVGSLPGGEPMAHRGEQNQPTTRISRQTPSGPAAAGSWQALTGWLAWPAKELLVHDEPWLSAQARRTATTDGRQLAGRSGTVAGCVRRAGGRTAGAGTPVPDRAGSHCRPDRGLHGAAGCQVQPGQHGIPGAGPAADGAQLAGRGGLPRDQLPVRSAGLGAAGWRAVGRLQVKGTEHELDCQLDVDRDGGPVDDSSPFRITSNWILDSRWIARQWIPGLSRHITMTCSFLLEPDL